MRFNISSVTILALSLTLAACGSGNVVVKNQTDDIKPVASVKVERLEPYVPIQAEQERIFENELAKRLYTPDIDGDQIENADVADQPVYKEGEDLTIQYRFVQVEEGSQMTRLLTGGIGSFGEGNVTIEVTLLDGNKASLGKFLTEGKVSTGLDGGKIEKAVMKAADEAVSYVKRQFPPSRDSFIDSITEAIEEPVADAMPEKMMKPSTDDN